MGTKTDEFTESFDQLGLDINDAQPAVNVALRHRLMVQELRIASESVEGGREVPNLPSLLIKAADALAVYVSHESEAETMTNWVQEWIDRVKGAAAHANTKSKVASLVDRDGELMTQLVVFARQEDEEVKQLIGMMDELDARCQDLESGAVE